MAAGIAVGFALGSAPAHAAPPFAREAPRLRLHVETDFLSWSRYDPPNDAGGSSINRIGFGVGRPLPDSGQLDAAPFIGVGFGAAVDRRRTVFLGARAGIAVASDVADDPDAPRATSFLGELTPYFHWLMSPPGRARGYLQVRAGVGGGFDRTSTPSVGYTMAHRIYPLFGLGTGAHVFLGPVSLDLGLELTGAPLWRRTNGENAGIETRDPWSRGGTHLAAGITAGLSAWW